MYPSYCVNGEIFVKGLCFVFYLIFFNRNLKNIFCPIFFVPMPGLGGQLHPSPVKKSMTTIPSSLQACSSDWSSQDDAGGRQNFISTDHAPLSPQSSIASSGSEQTEEQCSSRNTFQEDGSGMKGQSSLP